MKTWHIVKNKGSFSALKFTGSFIVCSLIMTFFFGCQQYGPKFDPRNPSATATPSPSKTTKKSGSPKKSSKEAALVEAMQIATNSPLETVTFTNRVNPSFLQTPTEPFTLGPGDKLEVELLDDPSSRSIVSVGPDGKLYYSFLPGIDVWGLTLSQTKELLEKEFSKFLRDRAHVGLTLKSVESKYVWLLGRFQAPGVYPLGTPTTLLEALALAGGTLSYPGAIDPTQISITEEIADLRRAFVVRRGELLPVDFERLLKQGDLSQNIYLQPDDFVYMPASAAREVHVIGAVSGPRSVAFHDGLTLVGAIASAGGTIKESYLSHVAIVRGSLSQPKIAIINYKNVVEGRAADIALEPRDIVYVPLQPYRHLLRYANLILNTFVSSVAINEGAHAVTEETAPTGILIPLGSRITVTGGTPNGAAH